ncbi:MAG: sensor histidine kinase, partial [Eubacterium aggregans]
DNASTSEMVNYDCSRKKYAVDKIAPEDQEEFLKKSEPQRVMKELTKAPEYTFVTKTKNEDGRVGMIKTRFVPYDIKNDIYIMTRADVTKLLYEEEEKANRLREVLIVAEQANNAKSDFLASMSHDIRTPMNAIVGMCELAIADETDEQQVHESLRTIQSSSQLLLSLINNILEMSRIESGKMVFWRSHFR